MREIDVIGAIQKHAGKIRVGLAALTLGGLGGAAVPDLQSTLAKLSVPGITRSFEPSKAYADDLLKPPVFQGRDGRDVTIAPFENAGKAYIFTSETGLEIFNGDGGLDDPAGITYGGKVKLIVVSDFRSMNIGVRSLQCGTGFSIDVIGDVGGNGYMERAPNAMDILSKEMSRVPAGERGEYSQIGLILTNDALQRQASPDLIGGSIDRGIRSGARGCGEASPVSVSPAAAQPEQQVATESCSAGGLQIADLKGKGIVSVSGVPARVSGGLDLADHGIFTNGFPGLNGPDNPLRNVLGEPGAFLADPDNIPTADRASWDAKVKAGFAEYIRRSGPNVNFFDLQTNSDRGVSWNAEKGIYEFVLVLPKHVIVRIDAEEAKVLATSANGDRNIRFEMCQSGATRGVDFGHQTLFIRTPYEQGSVIKLESPTIPGTQVQVFGMEVKDPTAFASAEAAFQGVRGRQARPDYPEYFMHTLNMNDLTLGSAESPSATAPFQAIKSNY